jgi:hypothetical protein
MIAVAWSARAARTPASDEPDTKTPGDRSARKAGVSLRFSTL